MIGSSPLVAQQAANEAIFLEAAGNGGLYSINYDRKLGRHLSARAGYAEWKIGDLTAGPFDDRWYRTFPLLLNAWIGGTSHWLEIGMGTLLGQYKTESGLRDNIVNATGVVGYRYQPATRGFMFRIGVTPHYSFRAAYPGSGRFVSLGVSAGWAF